VARSGTAYRTKTSCSLKIEQLRGRNAYTREYESRKGSGGEATTGGGGGLRVERQALKTLPVKNFDTKSYGKSIIHRGEGKKRKTPHLS